MLQISDVALRKDFAALPIATYGAGEIVLTAGSKIGRLLILREGTVTIAKNGIEIATISDPGTVFGELSFLLDQPPAADVRALDRSEFHVADGTTPLARHSLAINEIAALLAERIDDARCRNGPRPKPLAKDGGCPRMMTERGPG